MPDYGRTLETIFIGADGRLGTGQPDGLRPLIIRLSEPVKAGETSTSHALLTFGGRTMGFPVRFGDAVDFDSFTSRGLLATLLGDYSACSSMSFKEFAAASDADERELAKGWRDLNLLSAKLERVLDDILPEILSDIVNLEK